MLWCGRGTRWRLGRPCWLFRMVVVVAGWRWRVVGRTRRMSDGMDHFGQCISVPRLGHDRRWAILIGPEQYLPRKEEVLYAAGSGVVVDLPHLLPADLSWKPLSTWANRKLIKRKENSLAGGG